jgi:hypothetical protein
VVLTSLAFEDSLSYRQISVASKQQALAKATRSVWHPSGGALPDNYKAAACFDNLSLEATAAALGGGEVLFGNNEQGGGGYQAQIVQQVMQQMFGSNKESLAFLQLSVLAECAGVFAAEAAATTATTTAAAAAAAASSVASSSSLSLEGEATPCSAVWTACASKLHKALPAKATVADWLPMTADEARTAAVAAASAGIAAAAAAAASKAEL